jgi:hypothetical protein
LHCNQPNAAVRRLQCYNDLNGAQPRTRQAMLSGRALPSSTTTSSPYDCEWASEEGEGGGEECPRAFHSQSSVVPPRREAPRLPPLPPPRSRPSKWVNANGMSEGRHGLYT